MNSKVLNKKTNLKLKNKKSIRSKLFGTVARPRISIFRSNKHIFVQAIDDANSVTLASLHTKKLGLKSNKDGATKLGEEFSKTLAKAKIDNVIYDRNGYIYHGVVAAFADALRANNIKL